MTAQQATRLADIAARGQQRMAALRTIETMIAHGMHAETICTLVAELRHQLGTDFTTFQAYVFFEGESHEQNP